MPRLSDGKRGMVTRGGCSGSGVLTFFVQCPLEMASRDLHVSNAKASLIIVMRAKSLSQKCCEVELPPPSLFRSPRAALLLSRRPHVNIRYRCLGRGTYDIFLCAESVMLC